LIGGYRRRCAFLQAKHKFEALPFFTLRDMPS